MTLHNNKITLAVLLSFLFMLLAYMPFLSQMELVHEEPRRVIVTQNMLDAQDFLVPTQNQQVYMAKPPFYNWWMALVSLPFSQLSVEVARTSSVVVTFFTSLLFIWMFGQKLNALSLIFLISGLWFAPHLANKLFLAEIEPTFIFTVTAGLWCWWWQYQKGWDGVKLWLLPTVILAISFLTKREPAILFHYFPIIAFLIYQKDWKKLFGLSHLMISFGLFFIALFLWPYPLIQEVGVIAFWEDMKREVLGRGAGGHGVTDYLSHFVSYPFGVWAAILPFSAPLLALFFSKTLRQSLKEKHPSLYVFAIIAIIANLPLYLSRPDIAIRYFMPLHPTLLLLASFTLQELIKAERFYPLYLSIFAKLFYFITLVMISATTLRFFPALDPFKYQTFGAPWIAPLSLVGFVTFALFILAAVFLFVFYQKRKIGLGVFSALVFIFAGINWRMVEVQILLPQKSLKLDQREQLTPHFQKIKKMAQKEGIEHIYAVSDLEAKLWFYDKDQLFWLSSLDEITQRLTENPDQKYWIIYNNGGSRMRRMISAYRQQYGEIFDIDEVYRIAHRGYYYIILSVKNELMAKKNKAPH